jgi:HEAT repeat protein
MLVAGLPACVRTSTRNGERPAPSAPVDHEPVDLGTRESNPEPDAAASLHAPTGVESQPETLADVVADENLDEHTRRAAAAALLDLDAVDLLVPLLENPKLCALVVSAVEGMGARACVALDASKRASLSVEEWNSLITLATATRTQRAAGGLVALAARESPIGDQAIRALSQLTGLPRQSDASVWRGWWAAASQLSSDQWSRTLIEQHAERAGRMEARATGLERIATDLYRRLYFVGDQTARVGLLAEMLAHEQRSIQSLGFELADRELSANVTLGTPVEDAALALLSHADPEVRSTAARLINRLAPARAAGPMLTALMAESSPVAAESLLIGVSRWPDAAQVPVLLRWMREPRTVASAAQAAVALYEAGLIASDEHREAMRSALFPMPPEPSASQLLLLSLIGTETERAVIADLLGSSSERVRLSAIDALCRTPESGALLVERLERNPVLIAPALVGLARHGQLVLVSGRFEALDLWSQAFALASTARAKSAIADQILIRFANAITPEDAAMYQAATQSGG